MLNNFYSNFVLFQLILLSSFIQSIDEYKYFFQIYPSIDINNPHYFYAQTNKKLLTINATEGSNCQIVNESTNEYNYKNISSVIIINDTYLVKTCFMDDKLVEIKHGKNIFLYLQNLNNIDYCYSSQILNPIIDSNHREKYVIITYYMEKKSDGKYTHKAILFYPLQESFSEIITLRSFDSSINDRPENCVTFRDTDIYCLIHYSGNNNGIVNNYIIETNKLFSTNEINTFLVISNSNINTMYYFTKIIALNREETGVISGSANEKKDIYLTECHQKDLNITLLYYNYYFQNKHRNDQDYGLRISMKEIDSSLLNYITPNQDEMLIIYLNKNKNQSNLLIYNITTKNIDSYHKGNPENNYYRADICSQPMYMQSIYIKSFINYEEKDKDYIRNNPDKDYYKYEKDIGIVISCKENEEEIKYQAIKVKIPQCLNELDEINRKDIHKLEFTEKKNEIVLDIYNDPNMVSFRNNFIFFDIFQDISSVVEIKLKKIGENDYLNALNNKEYGNISLIKFIINKNISTGSSIKISYWLKNSIKEQNIIVNGLKSNLCYLEFTKVDDITPPTTSIPQETQFIQIPVTQGCLIEFCIECEDPTKCKTCDSNIEGLFFDKDDESETYGRCICDKNRGFKKRPELYQMCICQDDYSFYNGKNLCNKTEELEKGPYYIDDIDKKSNISIYKDCPKGCKKCTKVNDKLICLECFEDFLLKNNECNIMDKCDTDIWFELDNYIFKYIQIKECSFIFEGSDLFLISDKEKCRPLMNISNYEYITKCLKNDINLTKFLDIDNVNIYNSTSEGIIADKYSEDNKTYFHLIKYESNKNIPNISLLEIQFPLKDSIPNNQKERLLGNEANDKAIITENYLIFKADIIRDNIISMQVVFQIYNSCKINKKITLNDEDKIHLYLPVQWKNEDQRKRTNYLYNNNINAPFNSSSEFYSDVCYDFSIDDKKDMFLEDRKKDYYINESLCESGCHFLDYKRDLEKIICECTIKEKTNNSTNIDFVYNKIDEKFDKEKKFQNLATLKCISRVSKSLGKNLGFFFTFFSLVIFFGFFLYRLFGVKFTMKDNLEKIEKQILNKTESEIGKTSEIDSPKIDTEDGLNNKGNTDGNNNINIEYGRNNNHTEENTEKKMELKLETETIEVKSNHKNKHVLITQNDKENEYKRNDKDELNKINLKKTNNESKGDNLLLLKDNKHSLSDKSKKSDHSNKEQKAEKYQENQRKDNPKIYNKSTIEKIERPSKEIKFISERTTNKGNKNRKKNSHKTKPNPPKSGGYSSKTTRQIKKRENISGLINEDYLLDIMKYQDLKSNEEKDKRNIFRLWLSLIKSNSNLYFIFSIISKLEDIFIKASLIILLLNIYLFFNTLLLNDTSRVELYSKYFNIGNFILNIVVTTFPARIIAIVIKKNFGITNFFLEFIIKCEKEYNKNNLKNEGFDFDISHEFNNITIPFRRKQRKIIVIYGVSGILFLSFNCLLVTCFCGIFDEYVFKLFLNTFMSILFSNVLRALFYLIGAILRYYGLKKNSETVYNISRFFNPLYLSIDKIMCFAKICKKNSSEGN